MLNYDLEKLVVDIDQIVRTRFFGKYRGTVEDVNDPEELGRIVVKVPEIYGEKNSPWASPSVPFAGSKHGLLMLPKRGDGVWVEFEAGDPSRPIWTGFWWAKEEIPDEKTDHEIRLFVTPSAHKLILDDKNKLVQIIHSDGAEIQLSKDEILITTNSTKISLSSNEVSINDGVLVVKK